jgi:hypothetical protein
MLPACLLACLPLCFIHPPPSLPKASFICNGDGFSSTAIGDRCRNVLVSRQRISLSLSLSSLSLCLRESKFVTRRKRFSICKTALGENPISSHSANGMVSSALNSSKDRNLSDTFYKVSFCSEWRWHRFCDPFLLLSAMVPLIAD